MGWFSRKRHHVVQQPAQPAKQETFIVAGIVFCESDGEELTGFRVECGNMEAKRWLTNQISNTLSPDEATWQNACNEDAGIASFLIRWRTCEHGQVVRLMSDLVTHITGVHTELPDFSR